MANGRALDIRWGRGGGRRLPDPQTAADVASIEKWRTEKRALEAAAAANDAQLTIFDMFDPEPA